MYHYLQLFTKLYDGCDFARGAGAKTQNFLPYLWSLHMYTWWIDLNLLERVEDCFDLPSLSPICDLGVQPMAFFRDSLFQSTTSSN